MRHIDRYISATYVDRVFSEVIMKYLKRCGGSRHIRNAVLYIEREETALPIPNP